MRRRLSREQARAQAACVRQAAQEEAVRVQEDFLREVRGRSLKVIGQLALRGAIPELVEQAGWVEADLRDLIRAPRLAADAELTTLVRQARRAGVVVVQLDDSGVPVAPVAPADGGCRGGEGTLTAATGHLDTAPSGARGEGTHLAGRKDAALGSVPRGGEGPERPPDLRNALGSVPRGGEGPAPVTNGDLPGRPVPRGVGPGPGAPSSSDVPGGCCAWRRSEQPLLAVGPPVGRLGSVAPPGPAPCARGPRHAMGDQVNMRRPDALRPGPRGSWHSSPGPGPGPLGHHPACARGPPGAGLLLRGYRSPMPGARGSPVHGRPGPARP